MTPQDIAQLIADMADPARRTAEVVDRYYTQCIPFYREFLGPHWHTGYYAADGPIGTQDQLRMERVLADSVSITAADHVLDVGCGMGGPACHLAQITGARFRGLTPNTTQLALARSQARQTGVLDRVSFDQGWAGALPYPDGHFDVVLFFESACHFPDRLAFFKEAYRVLRPGGRMAGEDWLATDGLSRVDIDRFIRPIGDTWAIPTLGSCLSYAQDMAHAGFAVQEAVDMRREMAVERGFIIQASDRAQVRMEMRASPDPIRRIIMEGLLRLGEATEAGAFTVGRFKALKPQTVA